MAKPELGTKRICPVTGRKFYDLNKSPVISPYTGEVVPIAPVVTRGGRPEAKVPEPAAAAAEVEAPETENAEFVSLEDADAESTGGKAGEVPDTGDDDIDVEDDGGDDDSTFIEEDEEGDDDVTDIIGDGIEKDEET